MRRAINYELETESELFAESFSNYDVIDSRIDVGAQRALIRLRSNPATSANAAAMLGAVKSGQLAGIYGDDLRAAAQLAAYLGTVRWELVPRGRDALLIRRHVSAPPSMIFRANIRDDRVRLDRALLLAWAGFRKSPVIAIQHPQFGFVWSEPSASSARRATRLPNTSLRPLAPPQFLRRPSPMALESRAEAQLQRVLTERALVPDTTRAPLRWICSLIIEFGEDPDDFTPAKTNRLLANGTGVLISPIHVLTAGHNITNFQLTGSAGTTLPRTRATHIFVIPGRNSAARRKAPFGLFAAATMRVSKGWHKFRGRRFDFGLITLTSPVADIGFWGSQDRGQDVKGVIRPINSKTVKDLKVVTSGYPADKCGTQPANGSAPDEVLVRCRAADRSQNTEDRSHASTQWLSNGVSTFNNTENLLDINDLGAVGGQSGGPIWTGGAASPTLVAIMATSKRAAGQSNFINQGVPISRELLVEVSRWMRADKVRPSFG